MKLIFKEIKKFGKSYIWPDSKEAQWVLDLLERKCLKESQIEYLQRLGHEVIINKEEIK